MSIYKGTTLIAGSLPNAANQDLSNLSQTGQAVIDGKADTDLANVTNTGKVLMSGMGMPSNKYIDLTLGASGTTYTAPANGYFFVDKLSGISNGNAYIQMINSATNICFNVSVYSWSIAALRAWLPIIKGETITISYNAKGANQFFRFIYAVGSESEAS